MFDVKELHGSTVSPANFLCVIFKGASGFKVMSHEMIRNDECISTIQHCDIVVTLFQIVMTLFQLCNAVLR